MAFSPDGKLLAVGRKTSIDLLGATNLAEKQSLPQPEVSSYRRIVFSPDGQWLATEQEDGFIRLWDYLHKDVPEAVQAGEVGGFAVLKGGKRIIIVDPKLKVHAIQLEDGGWRTSPVELSTCMTPQSASEGAVYFSATWKAHVCTYSTLDASEIQGTDDHVTFDIIWSPGGRAYVEILSSMDLAVGTGDRSLKKQEKLITGARPFKTDGNKSPFMSVNESGSRFALIDQHDRQNRLVRVYSLDEHDKPDLDLSKPQNRASIERFTKWLDPRLPTRKECNDYELKCK